MVIATRLKLKITVLLVSLALSSSQLQAFDQQSLDEIKQASDQAKAAWLESLPDKENIMAEAEEKAQRYQEAAHQIRQESEALVTQRLAEEAKQRQIEITQVGAGINGNSQDYLVFVSSSLGDKILKQILEGIAGKNATAVIRGLFPSDKSLNDTMARMSKLIDGIEPTPNLILDPTLFKKHSITVTPVVVARDVSGGVGSEKEIARVSGIGDINWLAERIVRGDRGDLGVYGITELIDERDLTEEIQDRVSKIDFAKKKAEARERVWKNYTFTDFLPVAKKDRVREVDPSVETAEDVPDGQGGVLFPRGLRYNPLKLREFTGRLIVFDATDPQQVELIKDLKTDKEYRYTNYISTRLDRENGWDFLKKIQDELNAPVYLLNTDLVLAFQLEAIPAVVTADNHKKRFIVEEFKVEATK